MTRYLILGYITTRCTVYNHYATIRQNSEIQRHNKLVLAEDNRRPMEDYKCIQMTSEQSYPVIKVTRRLTLPVMIISVVFG